MTPFLSTLIMVSYIMVLLKTSRHLEGKLPINSSAFDGFLYAKISRI